LTNRDRRKKQGNRHEALGTRGRKKKEKGRRGRIGSADYAD